MALILHYSFSLFIFALVFSLSPYACFCFYSKHLNVSKPAGWSSASATWYGSPIGAGSDGGACGYGPAVEVPPFSKMVSAGGPSIFARGQGCGVCYQIKCTANPTCSGSPVTVTITDECPGCPPVHFDLSGTAFGAMAKRGQANQLRKAGRLQVQYTRVPCNYRGVHIGSKVDPGSNPNFIALLIEYENDDGSLSTVQLQQGSGPWLPMERLWGATWKLNSGSPLRGPFSIRLTESIHNKTVVAKNVIPVGWKPGSTYRSVVNFKDQVPNNVTM